MRTIPNHNLIERDFPESTILAVEEFYVPGMGFTSTLDGGLCSDNDRSIDDTLCRIFRMGASSVNLKIRTKKNKIVHEDYQVQSLFA